ncbi:MAG: hypothetical protein CVU39_25115 [Chloroflexi bacterium HGW-Chloroflexi-10]|nr:MAG: hypothetical protein CVU39_25115 [Chloroflexi bacterium HGW-Chloroflexi-10]
MTKKKFIIGGRIFELELLGQDIDQAFINLHAAYFSNQPLDLTEFENKIIQFFDANPKPSTIHNCYFHNFTVIWSYFLSERNFSEAEHIWDIALSTVLQWEQNNPNERIHKGTAYYFWGMTALKHGDLDKGYTLMHQAVEEDILTEGNPFPDTPALAFATLNYAKTDQKFRQWVIEQANFVNERLVIYATLHSRTFNLEEFRTKFLLNPPSVDTIFIFAFALARLNRLFAFPPHITQSRFSGQLQANILFDITLVIDATIRAKNPTKRRFVDHAEYLLQHYGHPLSKQELRDINNFFKNDFEATLNNAISGTLLLLNGTPLTRIQSDLAVAYGLRNHEAHDISSVAIIWRRFQELAQCVMNTLFASVDFL